MDVQRGRGSAARVAEHAAGDGQAAGLVGEEDPLAADSPDTTLTWGVPPQDAQCADGRRARGGPLGRTNPPPWPEPKLQGGWSASVILRHLAGLSRQGKF